MLKHKRCGGRVFYDTLFSGKNEIELYCLMCGNRWSINKENEFAKWLESQ